jgi:YesN/AraC family two-component response regulator
MNQKEKIILIDDQSYEVDLVNQALAKLHLDYEIIYFSNARDAYNYFEKTKDPIFIIISDINMPGMNGIELR